jgi:multidrug efflux system membrane fusion protein
LWILVAIVAAILLAFLLTPHAQPGPGGPGGPGGRGGRGGPGGRPTTVVGVATVTKGDIPIELDALGSVTPLATVNVQPRISGNLVRLNFREGQMVKAGQELAVIDDRPYVIAVKQAQGQLLRDQAALTDAQLDLKRYTQLNAQDSIAKQQVDTQAALVKQDEGVVETDEATLANAKLNVEYCHITAPVSGKVGLRQVDLGNYVTPSSSTTGLVVITEIDPIDVEFTLPEDSVPQVQARVATGATLTATALDRSGAITLGQGTLSTLDNEIDSSTGTVKAKARFNNPGGALFPNQFVNIKLLVDTVHDALVVPSQAVRHGAQGDYVYTVDLDQNAKMTPVKVGPIDGERTSILSGVSEGDLVITDGGDRLHDGSPVTLPADAAAMQNAPPPAKKPGLFGWIASLFGKKPPAGSAYGSGAAGPGASAPGGQASGAQGSGAQASGGWGGGGPGGGHGGHGGGGAHMQQMLDGLDLTADQKAKIRVIVTDLHAKAAAAGDDFNARRAIMQAGNAQIETVLTPEQKAKFEQERAAMRAAGGWQGGGGSAPPAGGQAPGPGSSPASAPTAAPSAPAASAPAARGGWSGGGGNGGGGGRMAGLIAQLNLDADQQAKQQAIFAAARAKAQASGDPDAYRGAMHEAMTQFEAILRPDQKAKLAQLRAQQGGPGGGSGGGAQ